MYLRVNGHRESFAEDAGIIDILEDKDLNPARIIFVVNDNVIDKKEWKSIKLQEEDSIEILKFVGGG